MILRQPLSFIFCCRRRLFRQFNMIMRCGHWRRWLAPMLTAAMITTLLASMLTSSASAGPPVRLVATGRPSVVSKNVTRVINRPPTLLSVPSPKKSPRSPAVASNSLGNDGDASPQTLQFLRHLADPNGPDSPELAALRTKLPLLNSLAASEQHGDRSLLDRAKSCTSVKRGSAGTSLTLKHVQNFAYLHNEPDLCSGQLLLIAAVHSNARNFERRATIRRTWGSLRYVGSSRLQLVFFLGSQENRQLQGEIDKESRRYRDLVQLDFTENYRNMSLKHLSIYEWVLAHCQRAQYLLKVDDDTFTDVVHLVAFLQHSPPEGYYCSSTRGAKPQRLRRGPKAKWAVSRAEFSAVRYPPYCEGFGYVLRTSHLANLYVCSLFHKFFWIDDVYVTGVLATAAKVPMQEFWKGHSYTGQLPSLASERILDYIFLVADHNEFLEVVWHRLWRSVLQFSLDLTL